MSDAVAGRDTPSMLTRDQFRELFDSLSNWGRWGVDDSLGTLNLIRPAHVAAAARLVTSGLAVSMAHRLNTLPGPDNPRPVIHSMTKLHKHSEGPVGFARDFIGIDFHGDSHTHVDALNHVSFNGFLYNGRPAASVASSGATALDLTAVQGGVLGRGVLLDLPWVHGTHWLTPGASITPEDLETAENLAGVRVNEGDILVLRTGEDVRRRARTAGLLDGSTSRAGLSLDCAGWMHERGIAAFLPDGDGEVLPPAEVDFIGAAHALLVCAMGMFTADSLDLEGLSLQCRREQRWEFLVVMAPLVVAGGTGSPVNPLAVF